MAHPLEKIDKQKGIKANYDKIAGLDSLIVNYQLTKESIENIAQQLSNTELAIPDPSTLPSSKVPPPIELEGHEEAEIETGTLSAETFEIDQKGLNEKIEEKKKSKIPTPTITQPTQRKPDPNQDYNGPEL